MVMEENAVVFRKSGEELYDAIIRAEKEAKYSDFAFVVSGSNIFQTVNLRNTLEEQYDDQVERYDSYLVRYEQEQNATNNAYNVSNETISRDSRRVVVVEPNISQNIVDFHMEIIEKAKNDSETHYFINSNRGTFDVDKLMGFIDKPNELESYLWETAKTPRKAFKMMPEKEAYFIGIRDRAVKKFQVSLNNYLKKTGRDIGDFIRKYDKNICDMIRQYEKDTEEIDDRRTIKICNSTEYQ